jgi:CheY-like chemotaxis protein
MSKFRALVVDDEPQVRQMTARSLSRVGFDCEMACNGQDALEWIQAKSFDLVVADLKMPEVNGHKLATELLTRPRRPVIAILTGVEEPKLAKDLTARGVEGIFYKPVDFTEFAQDMLCVVEQRVEEARASTAINGAYCHQNAVETLSRVLESSSSGNNTTPDLPNSGRGSEGTDADKGLGGNLFSTQSDSLNAADATHRSAQTAAAVSDGHRDCDVYLSRTLSTRIDAELVRTRKALIELQRTVARGQNSSYINMLIALGAGLAFGLVIGWLSSHMLTKFEL